MSGPSVGRDRPGADGRATWDDVRVCFDAGLSRTASDKGRAALRHVYDAVSKLGEARGDLTFRSVGDWCVKHRKGPTAQSIQNNDRLADIVRVASAALAATVRPRGERSAEEEILDCIGDPEKRSAAEVIFVHRRALIVEVTARQAAARRAAPLALITAEMAAIDVTTLEELAARLPQDYAGVASAVSEDERTGCRNFLVRDMAKRGFSIDAASGEIVDRSGFMVAEPGVASALKRIAGMEEG